MFSTGSRAFSIACIALMVVAGLHTLGHFSPSPQDPASRALEAALKRYSVEPPLITLALVLAAFVVAMLPAGAQRPS